MKSRLGLVMEIHGANGMRPRIRIERGFWTVSVLGGRVGEIGWGGMWEVFTGGAGRKRGRPN